jgi:hypothetical protein
MWLKCKQSGNGITSIRLLQRCPGDFLFRLIVRKNVEFADSGSDFAQLHRRQCSEPAPAAGI